MVPLRITIFWSASRLMIVITKGGALAAFNYGVDSHLWKLMAKNGDEEQKVSELAKELKLNENVLSKQQALLNILSITTT